MSEPKFEVGDHIILTSWFDDNPIPKENGMFKGMKAIVIEVKHLPSIGWAYVVRFRDQIVTPKSGELFMDETVLELDPEYVPNGVQG